jgi:type IV pilus assembly protein PilM
MDLTIVDIDHLALANCFLALEPGAGKEAVILLNIGHTQTNLSIVDAGELRFVRNVAFGGRDITRIIAQIMGISEEHAEDLKKNPQIWKECGVNIKDILRRSLPDVLEAIYRSIEYCMNRKKLVCVDRILLTGGSAALPGVSDFMKDALGIAAVPWNPLTRMNIAQKTILDMGYYLTVSIGLGMRESIYV